ncbi:MAG: ATP-grasp domain-containing protein [Bacteroidota bacterium]
MTETVNILISSAGTASAINVIKSLRLQTQIPVKLIALDADELAAGLRLADKFYIVPRADSKDYIATIIEIAKKENAVVFLPIYSGEIQLISEHSDYLKEYGLLTLLPEPDTIALCNNKNLTADFLSANNILSPKAYSTNELKEISDSDFPLFVKPHNGSSSNNTFRVESRKELDFYLSKFPDLVVQQFIEGEEVTVDVFCNRTSEALVVAPRMRISVKSGQSVKAKTLDNSAFAEPVSRICRLLKMVGVCNMQFILNEKGMYFIEVNPRYAAGGLMLTVNAGANIPLLVLKEILGLPIQPDECKTKTDVFMSRYWEEVFW